MTLTEQTTRQPLAHPSWCLGAVRGDRTCLDDDHPDGTHRASGDHWGQELALEVGKTLEVTVTSRQYFEQGFDDEDPSPPRIDLEVTEYVDEYEGDRSFTRASLSVAEARRVIEMLQNAVTEQEN